MPNLMQIALQCLPPGGAEAVQIIKQPPQPEPAAPAACSRFTGGPLQNGLPSPGSAEFCDSLEQFGDTLSSIYDNLIAWIDSLDPVKVAADQLKLPVASGPFAEPWNTIARLWNGLVDGVARWGRWLFDLVKAAFLYIKDLHECLTARCNSKAALAITLLRAVVRSLEKIRAGADPGVWITADLAVEFKLINNWLDHAEMYFCPLEIPEAEQATEAWLLDRITQKHRDCIWRLHGYDPDTYEVFATTKREQVDWREAIQYVRRKKLGDANERAVLRQRGFTYDLDVDMAQELYWELPTIADHLHWLQRQVFDPVYVAKYRLMDGFEEKFWPAFGPDLTSLGMRKEYAERHFAAHWIMPSPEQMKEFVYRSDEIVAAGGNPFTVVDYDRILAEQDYNVLARQWFAATVYQIPAISYIKDMFRQDIIDVAALRTYHQRLGYTEEDADRFSRIDQLQKSRMRAAQTHGWTTAAANSAYANGKMDIARHEQIFTDLGYTPGEAFDARTVADIALENRVITRARSRVLSSMVSSVTQALDVGVVTSDQAQQALVQAGWPRSMSSSFVAAQAAVAGTRRIKSAVGFLRSQVVDGTIDFATAQRELSALGINQTAAGQYLALWRMQMTPRRKRRSADKVVDDVANRRMTAPEAIVRLHNLGYDDPDSRLYLAEAQSKLVAVNQKRIAAQQKAGAARQKALVAAAKAADKAKADLAKAMKRDMPDGKLKALAKLGLIGRDLFMYRMAINGHTPTAAKLLYEEACAAKGADCKETVPGQTDPRGSGGGDGQPQPPGAGGTGDVPTNR